MSAERDNEVLIEALVENLQPVRPLPALRTIVLAVVGVWLAVALAGAGLLGLSEAGIGALFSRRSVSAIYLGLGLAGAGGIVAAVALGVPGRERLAGLAALVGLLGLALAAGLGSVLVGSHAGVRSMAFASSDLGCLGVACTVAVLPALGIVAFLGRAAPFRPLAAVLGAAAGAAALGAVSAQLSCPNADPQHLMLGHILAPAAGVLLLTLPLLAALRHLARDEADV